MKRCGLKNITELKFSEKEFSKAKEKAPLPGTSTMQAYSAHISNGSIYCPLMTLNAKICMTIYHELTSLLRLRPAGRPRYEREIAPAKPAVGPGNTGLPPGPEPQS